MDASDNPEINLPWLIQALGGRMTVATLLDTTDNAVTQWLRQGIPYKHFKMIVRAADANGIPGVTIERLLTTTRAIRSQNSGKTR